MNSQTATATQEQTLYFVYKIGSSRPLGKYTELKRARRAVDRLDLSHGSYAHCVKDSAGRSY